MPVVSTIRIIAVNAPISKGGALSIHPLNGGGTRLIDPSTATVEGAPSTIVYFVVAPPRAVRHHHITTQQYGEDR
jgi:hypothetical protein